MTFYKKLQKMLDEKRALVLVQRDDENYCYCILSPIKDSFGNYRDSGWWTTEKIAKEYIGLFAGYTEGKINQLAKKENWRIIKTYPVKDLI